eukprot:517994_1
MKEYVAPQSPQRPSDTKSFVDLKRKVQTLESDNTGLTNKISAMERTIEEVSKSMDVLSNELSNKVNRDGMKKYALESVLNNKISVMERTMQEMKQSIDVLTNELSTKVNHDEMKDCVPPQPPQPPPAQNQRVNGKWTDTSFIWIVSAVVVLIFAILYKSINDISRSHVHTELFNIVMGPVVKIELKEHSNRKHWSNDRPSNLLQDNGYNYGSAA